MPIIIPYYPSPPDLSTAGQTRPESVGLRYTSAGELRKPSRTLLMREFGRYIERQLLRGHLHSPKFEL
jgi:hypothetical protein